jgi:prevent-host-death family protein
MSKRYSIAEARASLPTIVDQAEAGQEIEITRRGKPVAVVISSCEFDRLRGEHSRFRDAYKTFIKKYPLREAGLNDDFLDSIRRRDSGRKVTL